MNEWNFWEEGIIGIIFIIMGITFIAIPNRDLKAMFKKKILSPQKLKGKRWLFIIAGIVFVLFGILSLVGYIEGVK